MQLPGHHGQRTSVRSRRNVSLREYSPFPQGMTGGLDRLRLIQPTVAFGGTTDIEQRTRVRSVRAIDTTTHGTARQPDLQPACTLTSIHRVKKSYGPCPFGIGCCRGTDATERCAKDEEGRHRWFQCS